jgi:MFS family permease
MGFFDRQQTVAGPGYNRWLFPPAALAVHLSIGQVYAFSVFKLPLTKIIGVTKSAPDDWSQPSLAWIFSLAIFFLGLSAAIFGRWVERVGPRKTMFTAALCFGGGFVISAFGVWWHQLWIIYLGYGVIGGCGLGLGYISPVSTLVKWFPDRPGMATGMAIMGFGGGAFIGSNLSLLLMDHFKSATSEGVGESFLAMGIIYFCFMVFGSIIARVPADNWKPTGYTPPTHPQGLITTENVTVDCAWRTPQFWLLWVVLCFNVTAGIGILEQASPMIQEMFYRENSCGRSRWLRCLAEPLQHGGPLCLGIHQRFYRPEVHLRRVSAVRSRAVLPDSPFRSYGQHIILRGRVRGHFEHVRRRVRHYSGLLERFVWIHAGGRDSRPSADCMVGCRCPWSSSG